MGSLLWHADFSPVALLGFCCSTAFGILVPGPGIKPTSPALEDRLILNHWTTKEIPKTIYLDKSFGELKSEVCSQ